VAKVVAREVSCGRGRVFLACAAEARGWISPGPPLHTCSGPLVGEAQCRARCRCARVGALRVLPHHSDCDDAVAARRLKWEKYHENAAECAESDSDLEEVDITESESDDEDPLADIL